MISTAVCPEVKAQMLLQRKECLNCYLQYLSLKSCLTVMKNSLGGHGTQRPSLNGHVDRDSTLLSNLCVRNHE